MQWAPQGARGYDAAWPARSRGSGTVRISLRLAGRTSLRRPSRGGGLRLGRWACDRGFGPSARAFATRFAQVRRPGRWSCVRGPLARSSRHESRRFGDLAVGARSEAQELGGSRRRKLGLRDAFRAGQSRLFAAGSLLRGGPGRFETPCVSVSGLSLSLSLGGRSPARCGSGPAFAAVHSVGPPGEREALVR